MQFIPHYVAYNSSLRVLYLQHQALILLLTTHYSLSSTHYPPLATLWVSTYYSLPTTHYYSLLLTTTHYYSPTTRLTHSPPEHSPRRRGLSASRALLRDDSSEVRRVATNATPVRMDFPLQNRASVDPLPHRQHAFVVRGIHPALQVQGRAIS